MRCRQYLTELKLDLSLPTGVLMWLLASVSFAVIYILRLLSEWIPPEEHALFCLILCTLLSQLWVRLEQTTVTISLHDNRCWLRQRRLGTKRETSLPVSQIHSAQLEYKQAPDQQSANSARIVLITTLGMIPVGDKFHRNPSHLNHACRHINNFLISQTRFLQA